MTRSFSRLSLLTLAGACALLLGTNLARSAEPAHAPPAAAGHHDAHAAQASDAHEAPEPQFVMPATYAAAVTDIESHVAAIAKLIDDGKLSELHRQAAVIRKIADGMSKLVAAKDSGVPLEAYPEVLKASKALSGMFGRVDEAGDSGNVEESRKAQAELAQQAAILRKHAPAQHASAEFKCPMHPDVTSAAPGKCPKCGMALVKPEGK